MKMRVTIDRCSEPVGNGSEIDASPPDQTIDRRKAFIGGADPGRAPIGLADKSRSDES